MVCSVSGFPITTALHPRRRTPAPNRLLRALFGAEPLRIIGNQAREDLRARISALFDAEKDRFAEALATLNLPDYSDAALLYQATDHLEIAR